MRGFPDGLIELVDAGMLGFAAGVTLKASLLLALVGLATLALARGSAATRHLLWALALIGVGALPVVSAALPWSWEVLPELRMPWSAPESVPAPRAAAASAAPAVEVESGPASVAPSARRSPVAAARPGAAQEASRRVADTGAGSPTGATPDAGPARSRGSASGATVPVRPAAAERAADPSAPSPGTAALGGLASASPQSLVLLAWALVAAALAFHHVAGHLALRVLARRAARIHEPVFRREVARLRRRAGVRRPVRLLRSERTRVPMTWGVRRPVILLPPDSRSWAGDRVRLVLQHELAHVRRFDAATDAVARLVCVLHWFNPLVWWAAGRLRAESEQAADDLVLQGGTRASEYAGHLLDLVTTLGPARAPAGALPFAQRSTFEGRLFAILDPARERHGLGTVGTLALGACVLAMVAVLGAAAPASGADGAGRDVAPARPGEAAGGLPGDIRLDPGLDPMDGLDLDLSPEWERAWDLDRIFALGEQLAAAWDTDEGDVAGAVEAASRSAGETLRPPGSAATEPVKTLTKSEAASLAKQQARADTASIRALMNTLESDGNAEVRRTAAWALGEIEDEMATPALARALQGDTAVEVRRTAAWALGQIEDPAAAPALGAALDDGDVEVRRTALWALGQIESPEAVGPLSSALDDADAEVRKTAAWALGQIESPQAVGALSAALSDDDAEVREQAAWALGQIESAEAVGALGRALGDAVPDVRKQAAWALGQIESAEAVGALSAALRQDESAEVRRQAAWALGQIEAEASVPALAAALSDADPEVASMAAWAIGQVEPSTAPPELLEAARSGPAEARMGALRALADIEDPAAVPVFAAALRDENGRIRTLALRGLAEIRDEAAIQAIAELLQDPDPEVRAAAARALGGRRGGGPSPRPMPQPQPRPRPRPNGG